MKLKEGFITQEADGDQIMIAVGAAKFSGLVRSNKTAAFIVDSLKSDTTRESIVDAMAQRYDAPRDRIARDVDAVLNKLRSIGALDETIDL